MEVMWRGHGEGGGVTLRGAGGEMGEEAGAKRVAGVQALHGAQVAGNLRHTLSETQRQEVQGQSVGVKITYREREGHILKNEELKSVGSIKCWINKVSSHKH